ncbi:MAG TPA: hypothetical protein VHE30_04110 [Polyangiaceae bacterium]|nr:hypothetical protein [Polyangiaceae bacterium]
MERQHIETALQAANVALTGRRERQASSFASIELREEDPRTGHWEMAATLVVGGAAVLAVIVAWLY